MVAALYTASTLPGLRDSFAFILGCDLVATHLHYFQFGRALSNWVPSAAAGCTAGSYPWLICQWLCLALKRCDAHCRWVGGLDALSPPVIAACWVQVQSCNYIIIR